MTTDIEEAPKAEERVEKIRKFEKGLSTLPQVDLKTTHVLSGGVYARTMHVRAGTVLTGATHKKDHINIFIGDFSVASADSTERFVGHNVLPCKAGAKRVIFAHTDGVWTTLVHTTKDTLEEIEDESVVESSSLQTRNPAIGTTKLQVLENK